MTDTDLTRVEEKLAYIAQQVADPRRLAEQVGIEGFAADPWLVRGAKYALQTAIEAMIDVAYHLAAKAFRYAPADGRDAIDHLARQGVYSPQQAAVFQEMLRFRNRVVHGYERVDDGRVYDIITHQLGDFDFWIQAIRAWLSRSMSG